VEHAVEREKKNSLAKKKGRKAKIGAAIALVCAVSSCQILVNQEMKICEDAENSERNAAERCSGKGHNESIQRTSGTHRSEADGDYRCHAIDR